MNLTTILDVCQNANAALVLKIGSWVDISHFEHETIYYPRSECGTTQIQQALKPICAEKTYCSYDHEEQSFGLRFDPQPTKKTKFLTMAFFF